MSIERIAALVLETTKEERAELWRLLERSGISVEAEVWTGTGYEALEKARRDGGTDRLRRFAATDPEASLDYATSVDKAPHDVSRSGACQLPEYARLYAERVDTGPREDTRRAASRSACSARYYAINVDQGPHDVTREGACQEEYYALAYAVYVDKAYHPRTWSAVRGTVYEEQYLSRLKVPEGEQ